MRTVRSRWTLVACISCCLAFGCARSAERAVISNEALATVDGQPIYEADLEPMLHTEMLKLKRQEYTLKSQALEALIENKLLEAEAKKQGLTIVKLLEQKVQVSEPAGEDIQSTYEANKTALKNRPLQEVREQVRDAVKQAQAQAARQNYTQGLRAQAVVKILLPPPPKSEVTYDPTRLKGDAKAPVTIVEFADFECPFCKAAQPTLKEVLAKYNGKVRLSYRDLPLREMHPHAQGSAEAARCAADQGKFWEYHDLVFADTSKLDAAGLKDKARTASLDQERFDSCLASRKFQAQIQSDLEMGMNAGVTGTPTFFINGTVLTGAQSLAAFEKIIDSELKKRPGKSD